MIDFNNRHYELITKESKVTGWRVQLWAEQGIIQRPMFRTFRLLLLGGVGMIAVAPLSPGCWVADCQIGATARR
jgi:hypothetical protein